MIQVWVPYWCGVMFGAADEPPEKFVNQAGTGQPCAARGYVLVLSELVVIPPFRVSDVCRPAERVINNIA